MDAASILPIGEPAHRLPWNKAVNKRVNTHYRLVEKLGRLIASGSIGHDGILPREDDLVVQFGVSRTVVREATKTLQALGLVITKPRVGSRIRPVSQWRLLDPQVMDWLSRAALSPELVRDLLDLRSMIEPAAAALAAERATPEQRETLMDALAEMKSAKTRLEHREADFAFHEAILEASGNALLLQLRPALHAVLEGSFRLSMHTRERVRASVAVHEAVAEAILRREPDEARKAMVDLLQVARRDIELRRSSKEAGTQRPPLSDREPTTA